MCLMLHQTLMSSILTVTVGTAVTENIQYIFTFFGVGTINTTEQEPVLILSIMTTRKQRQKWFQIESHPSFFWDFTLVADKTAL